ncbi:MAG: MFS transporter [Nocardioidaceae bacterium]
MTSGMPAANTDLASPPSTPPEVLRRATVGAAIGSVVEWFDVAVYAYLAAVIGSVFFSTHDPAVALVNSFAVFGAAFVVRPLGGMFFGALGDRIGRQRTLAWVIFLVSGSTIGIGLIPGYASIGVAAPVLLVALRLLQGFSSGGEMGGASAFVAEHSPARRRGYLVSLVEMGCILGFLLGSLVVLLLNLALTSQQVQSWGWRIPFLLAAPLGITGLYIRSRLEETPEFTALRERSELSRHPLMESVKTHWRAILRTAGYSLFQNATLYVVLSFIPSYLAQTMGYSSVVSSVSSVLCMVAVCALIPVMGAVSDRVGRRAVLASSCILALLFSYPLFLLMAAGSAVAAVIAHVVLGMILAVFLGPTLAAMNELFTTRVRYGGFSLGYNLSVSAFGGTAPFLVTILIQATGNDAAPALYIMGAAVITLPIVLTARETAPRGAARTTAASEKVTVA